MSRNYELYLRDILKAAERIAQYTANIDPEHFRSDDMRVDGVLFNLMTIGEAVKNIPDELQSQYPDIRWRDIGRFRDRIVHHYFGLDIDIVWEIVTVHLPLLKEFVEQLLLNTSLTDSDQA
jgi:uncharacterized protein with HEPN domain